MNIIAALKYPLFLWVFGCVLTSSVYSEIVVQTYLDINNNGIRDQGEELISGLLVTGYDEFGNPLPFLDDAAGTYLLPIVPGRIRVQVTGYDQFRKQGVAGPTSVFFAVNGDNILVPVSTGPLIDPTESRIMIPCYEGGPAEGKQGPGFVSFPYEVNGIAQMLGGSAPNPQVDAQIQEIGATWGVAFKSSTQSAFTSALLKRHVGLGPEGMGGFYQVDYSVTPDNPTVSGYSLQGLQPLVGPAINLGTIQRNTVSGDVDETMPFALTTTPLTATYDMDAFDKVGKASFGDIDMTEDESQLWMVNLNQRSLISLDISNGTVDISSEKVKHYLIDNLTGLPNLNFRYAMCINAGGNSNNTGAESFTDANSVGWDKNKYSIGGNFAFTSFTVQNTMNSDERTTEKDLYQTYRMGDFSYDIPIPNEETYTVYLHFAEPNNYVVGDRIFDIYVEGQLIYDNFDIVAHAGANRKATTVTFTIDGVGNALNFQFVSEQGNKIKQAILSGLEVFGESVMMSGVLRPWGLKFHHGKGYLGLVADASVSQSRDHLFGYVMSFDPNNVGAGLTEEVAVKLAYPRERVSNAHLADPQPLRSAEWQAWADTWDKTAIPTVGEPTSLFGGLLCSYPQPVLSDIDFADDGSIVIGLMDRWAHQCGYLNYPTILGDQTYIVAYGAGDLLKAFKQDDLYYMEMQNNDPGTYFRNDDGPSFAGEFFYDDHFVSTNAHHGEVVNGGLAILRGTQEVVNSVFNPVNTGSTGDFVFEGVYTQGIRFYDTEQGDMERAYLFVDQFVQGKANGLGDMEFLFSVYGGEIGNYVWCDANGNGIQDPNEFGIDGITLTLHDKDQANQQVDQTTTSNGGEYLFKDLVPGNCYQIRIDLEQLTDMGFSGMTTQADQGGNDEIDSDASDQMVPGYAVIMFCAPPAGEVNHSYDFGFLGPAVEDCTFVVCEDMGCGTFQFEEIDDCVDPSGINEVRYFPTFNDADSMMNEITGISIAICSDSMIFARVNILDDTMCYAIAKVTLELMENDGDLVEYATLLCEDSLFNAVEFLMGEGYDGDGMVFSDSFMTMVGDPMAVMIDMFPDTLYFKDTLETTTCGVFGLIIVNEALPSDVDAGDTAVICYPDCLELIRLGASFNGNNSGATEVYWSSSGDGEFIPDSSFANAQYYCPDTLDSINGSVTLYLSVLDDPCLGTVVDSVGIGVDTLNFKIIHSEKDTIMCTDSFVVDPYTHDTFPTCFIIADCEDTIYFDVVDYRTELGDCESDIVKAIIRRQHVRYNKQDYFCVDTICVMGIPMDMFLCPPERDSIYCFPFDTIQYDKNGNPHPSITGVPSYIDLVTMDTVPVWPQPPKVCEIVVGYKDTDFSPSCPRIINRLWLVKNLCTGDFMECEQWLMIFDTVKPVIHELDTQSLIAYADDPHDCFIHYKVPWIRGDDTCTGLKMVKARIEGHGTVVLSYNAQKNYWETNKTIKVPVTLNLFEGELPERIIYEFIDSCHNQTNDTVPFIIVDNTPPTPVCDKGINAALTIDAPEDSTIWVPAHSFDEGSRDDCGVEFLWARRTDWYKTCGVNLCDDLIPLCTSEHDDTLWFSRLQDNPKKNEIEAHYAETIKWLCEDGKPCSFWLLFGWWYDLIKHATLDCMDHPYPVNDQYFYDLIESSDCNLLDSICESPLDFNEYFFDQFKYLLGRSQPHIEIFEGSFGITIFLEFAQFLDIAKNLGGGWSKFVPFCCEDACQEVTVELLTMDYWCNWSTCWTTVWVEDKKPPKLLNELPDVTISCGAYKNLYADAVGEAIQGDPGELQELLGRYDKVSYDIYGNVPGLTKTTIVDQICDSFLVEKDSLVYKNNHGWFWKTFKTYKSEYRDTSFDITNGQIVDDCGLICIEDRPWVKLDHCGYGSILRTFKFVGHCTENEKGIRIADTLVRYQRIFIVEDCPIAKSMFDVPRDTIVEVCGLEYGPDGNLTGALDPKQLGEAKYIMDNDCRLVSIGYYDKVFKIVSGDGGCYKVVRTWAFADWCGTDKPIEKKWWLVPGYEGKILKCEQKIIVIDNVTPTCEIDPIDSIIIAPDCFYTLDTEVKILDACGLVEYSWALVDVHTLNIVKQGSGSLQGVSVDSFPVVVPNLTSGTYQLEVFVSDACENESGCSTTFTLGVDKKPVAICLSNLTVELSPMDLNADGVIDTGMATVYAKEFNSSSQEACGGSKKLTFLIDDGMGPPALPDISATKLDVGCEHIGVRLVRVYVLDPVGNWDFCEVILTVQDNTSACGVVAGQTGLVSGNIVDILRRPVQEVHLTAVDKKGKILNSGFSANGKYYINLPMRGEAWIRASKTADYGKGISTLDLIRLQRHIIGKERFTYWFQETAGDASYDGKITPVDIIHLRRLILGITHDLPAPSWRFLEEQFKQENFWIPNVSERQQLNFVGFRTGDVNGDYFVPGGIDRSGPEVTLAVDDYQFDEGEKLVIPVKVDQFQDIYGFQFTLQVDQEALEIEGVEAASTLSISKEHFGLTHITDGHVTVSWNNETGESISLEPGQILFSIGLTANREVQLRDVFTINGAITAAEAYNVAFEPKSIALRFTQAAGGVVELYQNYPNPFRDFTDLGFWLPKSAQAVITVFDITGKEIKRLEGHYSGGYNTIQLPKRDIPSGGIYYYQLDVLNTRHIKKMIFMD